MLDGLKGGKILIVEDEPLIGGSLKDVLEDAGFLVDLATDADEAMAILERDRARDLSGLVTDINLGGLRTGWDIAARTREMNPALPVVYMTGTARPIGRRAGCRTARCWKSRSRRRRSWWPSAPS
jgi:CheY-like chemotaxis protein